MRKLARKKTIIMAAKKTEKDNVIGELLVAIE